MTFRSFRFTSKNNEKMFTNLFKNLQIHLKLNPDSFQNDTQKNNRKKNHRIDKKSKFAPQLGTWGRGLQVRFRLFFVSGRPLEPKWSQDLLQEPPGPPWASIFTDFYQIPDAFFCSFCCFVGLSSMSLRHAETKNAVGTVAEIARRATGYISRSPLWGS